MSQLRTTSCCVLLSLPALLDALVAVHGRGSLSASTAAHRRANVAASSGTKWVLGLNQYSHDAGATLLSVDGTQSYTVPKERVTRAKCDGGDTAVAVEHILEAAGASPDDIVAVW
eukprot:4856035-Prymnesium_polylepis.1